MNLKIETNITINIKEQTLTLTREEAKILLDNLKTALGEPSYIHIKNDKDKWKNYNDTYPNQPLYPSNPWNPETNPIVVTC